MKKLLRNIFFVLVAVLSFSCGKPLPTELLQDTSSSDNGIQIETASPDPSTYVYSNGYDSTGVLQPMPDKSTVITVSGIRNSITNSIDDLQASYIADFYDKTDPVRTSQGKLVGYHTRTPGMVKFNNVPADKTPLRIRYMNNGVRVDSMLGFHFELRGGGPMHRHGLSDFPYNSSINFRLDGQQSNLVQFDIPTPSEIIGNLSVQGSRRSGNLKVEVNWNGTGQGKIDIIIGIAGDIRGEIYPYYKVSVADNGRVSLPGNLFEQIPTVDNQFLVITLIRSKEIEIQNNQLLNDNLIVAQSIHNIRVRFPD